MNKKIAKICMLVACCGGVSVAHAGDFQVTTIPLNAGDEFKFMLGAAGTFTVDCGDGGTLSGDDVSGNTITKNNTDDKEYKCTYSTDGEKTIDFGGRATEYISLTSISFDVFNNLSCDKIAKIDGTLGNIFPILNNRLSFSWTFEGCRNLEEIPEDLFSGINGATNYMFNKTFQDCSHLTNIPENLFSGVNGAAEKMFEGTFEGCSRLTNIPEDLFSGVNGAAKDMFYMTFSGCAGLTQIPEKLFSGGNGAAENMFFYTFSNCSNLEEVPNNLFSGVNGTANDMFHGTFAYCDKLDETMLRSVFGNASSLDIDDTLHPKLSSGFDFKSIDDMLNDSFWKDSVWTDADGGFNTARLVSDSVASVVLGTVGGVVTSNIIKKNQLKNGLQDLKCTIGGQAVASMGDEFTVEVK